MHPAEHAYIDKLADELRIEEVSAGAQLHQHIAHSCRSKHRVWCRQMRFAVLLLREVDRQESFKQSDISSHQGAYRTRKVVFHDFPGPFYVRFPVPSRTIYVHFPRLSRTLIEWISNKSDFHKHVLNQLNNRSNRV